MSNSTSSNTANQAQIQAQAQSNPLLDFSDLPRFGDIKPEHVTPALDVLLADAKAAVDHASPDGKLPHTA